MAMRSWRTDKRSSVTGVDDIHVYPIIFKDEYVNATPLIIILAKAAAL